MRISARATTTLILAATFAFATLSGCDEPPRSPVEQPLTVQSQPKPRPVTANACVGAPDGTSQEGCDRIWRCMQQECRDQQCVLRTAPGLPCSVPDRQTNESGSCDDEGICRPAQSTGPR
jgi:hypothetical protein